MKLLSRAGVEREDEVRAILAADAESDVYPLGPARTFWDSKGLSELEPKVVALSDAYRGEVFRACRWILERYGSRQSPKRIVPKARRAWAAQDLLRCGELLYECLEVPERVAWAARLLDLACTRIVPPEPVARLLRWAGQENRWPDAHHLFDEIRNLHLTHARDEKRDECLMALLALAETTAKVVYNASGAGAPFDRNCGWKIPAGVRAVMDAIKDDAFAQSLEQMLFAIEGQREK
jgi:hypothetical protein